MSDDYLWDRSGPPDPEVQKLEKLLAPLRHEAPLDEVRMRRKKRPPWLIVVGVAVAAAAAIVLFIALPKDQDACGSGEGFAFTGVGGKVSCGGARVAKGVLPVNVLLDTGEHEASLTIANIGSAKLGKQTRVRIDRTDKDRHQLALERGSMHAKVKAPPRLFAVTTKHTEIVDLGCEYTIEVDDQGAGNICVQSGLVELATKVGGIVVAPEGTCAAVLACQPAATVACDPGQRPGLPHASNARPAWLALVRAYERGEPGSFEQLLAAAEDRDAITLVGLASIDPRARAVLERLMELSPPPDAEITVDSALENPEHLAVWRRDIVEIFIGMYGPQGTKKSP